MKNKILVGFLGAAVLIMTFSSVSGSGQMNKLGFVENSNVQYKYTITYNTDDIIFKKMMGYDIVEIKDGSFLNLVGRPMLPTSEIKIALTKDIIVEQVNIIGTTTKTIDGDYMIFPSQPPQHTDLSEKNTDFVKPNSEVYKSSQIYPSKIVNFLYQTDLAGQPIAVLQICPLQYIPSEKQLILHTSITFEINGKLGYVCGDYLPKNISNHDKTAYYTMIKDMVINPADVKLKTRDNGPQTLGVGGGDYDYVIITQSSWTDDFLPLVDWKTKKGIPATTVTTDWIYSEYSGSSNPAKIRAFVQDAHNNWGTTYFLLGGDTNTVPYHTFSNSVGSVPSDTYYADYDSDWICEVHVGRASVRSTSAINTFINKIFTYEQNPPLTNYAKRIGLFGFDLYTYGSGEGEDCKEDIDSLYVPAGWDITKVYDSYSGDHETAVKNAINNGQNLLNHIDHSSDDFMGTGYINHGWGLYNSDMDNLYNGNKQSIFYSIGCDACHYDTTTCIAEHFVQNSNGGGVAFIGNSRYGWYSPTYDDYYSLRFDRYFFRSLFNQNHYKLGEAFSDHKNDVSMSDNTYKYIFQELTLLGDPELPIWTENPVSIDSVTYPNPITTGTQSFTVTVMNGGSPVTGALVCLQKDTEVYEYGTTNSNGEITFTIAPIISGTMDVTVTKHNYLPWEGTCTVTAGGNPPVPDVKINGQSNPPDYPYGTTITVTVSLDPGSYAGVTHDWWIKGVKNYTIIWWWKYPGQWKKSSTPILAIQYKLIPINNYVIFSGVLSRGHYEFTFAVDAPDGIYQGTYSDTVDITIY